MNRKVLKSILNKKFNSFTDSIEDEIVRKLVRKNSIITGGAIVSLLQNEKPKDYDIYFTNEETVLAVCKYYVKKFNERMEEKGNNHRAEVIIESSLVPSRIKLFVQSAGILQDGELNQDLQNDNIIDLIEEADIIDSKELDATNQTEKPFRPVYLSSNAITLSNSVQLINRFYGNAEQIHENYDFIHCTSYWLSETGQLYLNQAALESILYKDLRYFGSLYPIASLIRTRKFIKRGWNINAGQLLKMSFQISELDLGDVNVIEDQLTGVDQSYFVILLDAIKKKKEKEPDWTIDHTYVISIIDKIF